MSQESAKDILDKAPQENRQNLVEGHEIREPVVEGKPEPEFDPAKELATVETSLGRNAESIEKLRQAVDEDRKKIRALRKSLGITSDEQQEPTASETSLATLLEEHEKLERQKEELETAEDLNAVLEELGELPQPELLIIIETGKRSDGSEVRGPKGEVNPDVAKQLATLAEQGVKKITKAALQLIFGVVKGVLKAIFETAKGIRQ